MQIFINWQNFPTATILIKAQLFTFRVILQADSRILTLSLCVILQSKKLIEDMENLSNFINTLKTLA